MQFKSFMHQGSDSQIRLTRFDDKLDRMAQIRARRGRRRRRQGLLL